MTHWPSDAVSTHAVRARARHPRGITLIELLAAIAVIAVVMSIALPSLARVKAESVRLQCLINARSLATLVQSYATSNADTPPSWIERGVPYETTPARWIEYTTQNFTTFEHDRWLDYADFTADSGPLYCPANTARPQYYETVPEPDYWISSAFHVRPAYLDPALPSSAWYGKLGAGVQRMHSVRFPGAKSLVHEFFVWHGWHGRRCEGCEVGTLEVHGSDRAGSVAFADGHGELRVAKDAVRPVDRYPTWGSYVYDTTPHGVHGRDVP